MNVFQLRRMLLHTILATTLLTGLLVTSVSLKAVEPKGINPEQIMHGKALFEREWPARNPALGGDGLGPLHNAKSCVACHHQGGIGGSGDARFNSKSIGIEKMRISGGPINDDVIANSVSGFHPGFIDAMGQIVNTVAVSHHGGTPVYSSMRDSLMHNASAEFSADGGPMNAEEVRHANSNKITYTSQNGKYKVAINARMFQRNTTPLFGAGLIDQVTGKELKELARSQEKHPEISGRPATLPDGRYGRFGWRGNVASLLDFCDQACAAEVGLETARKPQPNDPTTPQYRNPTVDISDDQIRSMKAFIAALPAPTRRLPQEPEARQTALRGQQLFANVGCAVCHVPNVGPAKGIYSDLLLHDMGYESIDLNPADPYIYKVVPVSRIDQSREINFASSTTYEDTVSTTYYGLTSVMSGTQYSGGTSRSGSTGVDFTPITRDLGNIRFTRASYDFEYPSQPNTLMRFIPQNTAVDREVNTTRQQRRQRMQVRSNQKTGSGNDFFFTDKTDEQRETIVTRKTDYLRILIRPTNYMQEWRTPPLWGVRDSAPYMHDGRAATLLEAISMHDGEAAGTRDRFLNLSHQDRDAIVAFMETLVAPISAPKASL